MVIRLILSYLSLYLSWAAADVAMGSEEENSQDVLTSYFL